MKPLILKQNLRNQQRVECGIDAIITKPDGSLVHCTTANLSRTGVMLRCDLPTAKTLLPKQVSPTPGDWVPVSIQLSVPATASHPACVEANGHIVHMRRVARDEFHLGLQFTEFKDDGSEHVCRYVHRLLATAP